MNSIIHADPAGMADSVHAMKFLISPLYVIIGAAILWGGWGAKKKAQRLAVYTLTAIFLLCDFSGYAGPAFGAPWWSIFASHVLLVLACLVYILTNQHRKIFGDD